MNPQSEKQETEEKLKFYQEFKKTLESRKLLLAETIEFMGKQEFPEKNLEAMRYTLEANNYIIDKLNTESNIIAKDRFAKMYESELQRFIMQEMKDTENCEKYWNDAVKTMHEMPEHKVKKLPPALQTQWNEIKKDNANPESFILKPENQHNKNKRFELMNKLVFEIRKLNNELKISA